MARRLPRFLAIVLACSTVLAGVPLIAAPTSPDPQSGPRVASGPFDTEDVPESRCESSEEEREEGSDSELFLLARPLVAVVLDLRRTGRTAFDSLQAAAGSCDSARFIRGPPAG